VIGMADDETTRDAPAADASIGELVKHLSDVTSRLVRQETALAKIELQEKAREGARGAGMFGGAGLLGVFAFGTLTACAVLVLDLWMSAWLAALIVTVVYAAGAGLLALMGKRHVQEATPPVPEQAAESVKEDVRWAKTRAKSART
jgi:uncharacterized membrane protein YqjE